MRESERSSIGKPQAVGTFDFSRLKLHGSPFKKGRNGKIANFVATSDSCRSNRWGPPGRESDPRWSARFNPVAAEGMGKPLGVR